MSALKVLYVEDDHYIQVIARLALETVGGLTVLICSSGQEAIDELGAFVPDMVLLDVMMPGMDGPETLRSLRKLPGMEEVPIAFMTAKVQPHEIDAFKALGACEVIPKPFDPMTLADQVKSIWDQYHVS